MKKMGFSDKVIFILGLTLGGVITFVLVAGVIVAVISFFMESKRRSVQIHSVPILDDEPHSALNADVLEQRPAAEAIQLHDEAVAGDSDTVRDSDRIID